MYTTIALTGFALLAQTVAGTAIPTSSTLHSMHPRSDGSFEGFYHNQTLGNGVFSVHIDENGQMVHEKLADSSNSSAPADGQLHQRSTPSCVLQNSGGAQVGCENYAIDALDWATARGDFMPVCAAADNSNPVAATRAIYAVYGEVQMYFCNYAHTIKQACADDVFSQALGDIGCQCQNYLAGWEYQSSNYRKYGFVKSSDGFCSDNWCTGAGCYNTK